MCLLQVYTICFNNNNKKKEREKFSLFPKRIFFFVKVKTCAEYLLKGTKIRFNEGCS